MELNSDLFMDFATSFKYIAGPCSAESFAQLEETVSALVDVFKAARLPLYAFRAGAWKPRTRPGSFEGKGREALEWMQRIQQKYQVDAMTEVANARHVEQCLQYGFKKIWVGARSTASPFVIQEIADALRGHSDIEVWVKNPPFPDVDLWIGAIDRFLGAGIARVGGIHRGFGLYNSAPYRNAPLWEIPIELRRQRPDIPVICDPSHIGGERSLIAPLSQIAVDLEMQGLMIEVHPRPEEAMSDAGQQLLPMAYAELLRHLTFKQTGSGSKVLYRYRTLIDEIDEELLSVLSRRMDIVKKMGQLKKEENLSVLQSDRWHRLVEQRKKSAGEKGLDLKFTEELLSCIHAESIRLQNEIFSRELKKPDTAPDTKQDIESK